MRKIILLFIFIILCCSPAAFAKKAKTAAPTGNGYVGTLPDLNERFQTPGVKESEPSFDYKDNFNDQNDIKPAPKNNPAFVNIIMKTDKSSQYINDLTYLISIIESLQTVVEDSSNVQKFNAKAYFLKTNVDYFRDKYKNRAEGSYLSFKKVMQLNTHVQAIAQLRLEKETYTPYVTANQSGNVFSQNNVDNQLNYLLDEIKNTLVVLKQDK